MGCPRVVHRDCVGPGNVETEDQPLGLGKEGDGAHGNLTKTHVETRDIRDTQSLTLLSYRYLPSSPAALLHTGSRNHPWRCTRSTEVRMRKV